MKRESHGFSRMECQYFVVSPDGNTLFVDVKEREKGVSSYWKYYRDSTTKEPELTLEVWAKKEQRVPGWTLDSAKLTDYILYVFDEEDASNSYLFPLKDLRDVLNEHLQEWATEYGYRECTTNGKYTTVSIFVPITVVWSAIEHMVVQRVIAQKRAELRISSRGENTNGADEYLESQGNV